MTTPLLTPLAMTASLAWALPALAQDAPQAYGPADPALAAAEGATEAATEATPPADAGEAAGTGDAADDGPLFPIWGRQARERGIELLPAFGMAGMVLDNRQNLDGENLAIAVAKGDSLAADASLAELPFVVPNKLETRTTNYQFKADLWVFPFLDVFAAIGKSKGEMDIEVDIDLDAFVPFPFCRPAKPCGVTRLPFEASVDNTTLTLGGILAYGSEDWFVSVTAAKTLSVAEKERSDIRTTDIGARGGPRFRLGKDVTLSPYVGADYFDFDVQVTGLVVSGPLFEDGDPISLRYRLDLTAAKPWAAIMGGNLQIGRNWTVQGEYNWGQGSNRFMVSLTYRP